MVLPRVERGRGETNMSAKCQQPCHGSRLVWTPDPTRGWVWVQTSSRHCHPVQGSGHLRGGKSEGVGSEQKDRDGVRSDGVMV